ncbi:MAG: DNA-processing protein DprA [Planctomycetota bacterium]
MDLRETLIWLNGVPGLGGARIRALTDHFGSAAAIHRAGTSALTAVEGIGPICAAAIRDSDPAGFVTRECAEAAAAGIAILTTGDETYPAALRNIFDPPPVLYIRGEVRPADALAVAVVGSRQCSVYGATQAARLARGLAVRGVTVVSGCAVGIDAAAHKAVVEAGGRTIGVVGSGLMELYPPENRGLMDRIAGQGALISEFHLHQGVGRGNFVRRNRVIAGLALGVVVVEAARRSGALITARYAAEQGREVFAVPGSVDSPRSRGPHALLRDGAVLVEQVEDIIANLGEVGRLLAGAVQAGAAPPAARTLNGRESAVLACVEHAPLHIDAIIGLCGLPPANVAGVLTVLELRNLVKELPGKNYVRVP